MFHYRLSHAPSVEDLGVECGQFSVAVYGGRFCAYVKKIGIDKSEVLEVVNGKIVGHYVNHWVGGKAEIEPPSHSLLGEWAFGLGVKSIYGFTLLKNRFYRTPADWLENFRTGKVVR